MQRAALLWLRIKLSLYPPSSGERYPPLCGGRFSGDLTEDGGVLQRYMADHALTLGALVIEQLTPQTTHVIVTHMGQPIIKDIDSWPYASPRPEAVSVQWFYASCGTTNLSSSIHPVRKDIRYIISTGIQACVRQHENWMQQWWRDQSDMCHKLIMNWTVLMFPIIWWRSIQMGKLMVSRSLWYVSLDLGR